jgi:hypothetical protein
MSWALLEMASLRGAGFRVTHTPSWQLAVSLKSAQQSIQSKRSGVVGRKKRFFQAFGEMRPGKPCVFRDGSAVLMKMNGQSQTRTRRTRQP